MTSFNIIPDVIVLHITQQLLQNCSTECFASNLKWLKISHRWRTLALPYVHRELYFIYDGWPYFQHITLPEGSVLIKTNLHLVKHLGYVKSISIVIKHTDGLPKAPSCIEKALKLVTFSTRGICIKLSIYQVPFARNSSNEYGICQAASRMKDIVPSATSIYLTAASADPAAKEYSRVLLNAYADTLHLLNCNFPLELAHEFGKIKALSISQSEVEHYKVPLANVNALEWLQIKNSPGNHLWTLCKDYKQDNKLAFCNLKHLKLVYAIRKRDEFYPDSTLLAFPSLKTLYIDDGSWHARDIEPKEFPLQIDSIGIVVNHVMLKRISSYKLPAANSANLKVVLNLPENEMQYALTAVNKLLSKIASGPRASLSISSSDKHVSDTDLTFTHLTTLELDAPVKVDVLMGLLRKMSNLEQLCILKIQIGNKVKAIMAMPHANSDEHPLAPIHSRLKELVISSKHRLPETRVAHAVLYLLLRIPTPRKLSAGNLPQDMFNGLAKPYIALYPHIESVCPSLPSH
ncbi:hypothetical protein BX667DRAFT_366411 [Coemansia mojavensis]|nr:hypothetical protein BX667DRAFT_140128 [Coemansia mojavensis]KAI9474348.1 hypothetical protein BX667DRAFT_366411 [Coemansia mojavensis]